MFNIGFRFGVVQQVLATFEITRQSAITESTDQHKSTSISSDHPLSGEVIELKDYCHCHVIGNTLAVDLAF